jgi:Primase C terminal 1 (PriCT-1)/RepB DNA-primase from phage plasmid
MDRQAAETFLNHLDPDAIEFTFQTFTVSDQKKQTYGKDTRGRIIDPLARVLHGSLEEHYATLVELSRAGAGIFVTINKTTLSGRRNANNISAVRAYFAECDSVPADDIKAGIALLGLLPHIVTRSSRGKYHLYWCISGAPLAGFRETQKKLILLFGSDPQVHDLPRVMRIPGFPHQKDGSRGEIVQLVETIVADNYSEVQFQTALASALQQSQKKKIDRVISNLGSPPPDWTQGYPEGHRNNECARRAGFCFARGMTLEEALEKCLQWNRECNSPPLSDDEVAATVASIARTHSAKTGQNGFGTQAESNNANANSAPGGSPPHLPRILVVGGGLSNEASAGEDAILKAGWPIYQRGSMLVRPVVQVVDATCGRRTEVAQLAPIDLPYLKDVLCQSAEWYRWDARQKKHVRIDPPGDIAQTILHRSGQWKFPGVVGLITTQTLRPDGSLLAEPGFDPVTRLILAAPPPIPSISDQPRRDDALAAVKLLEGLLKEFPFADKASLSVALSCLITPVVRAAFPVAPMHVACAPTAGTGKSFLFDIAAAIAIGHRCPVMAAGRNEEETEKRLGPR